MLEARPYQLELLELAKKKNIIVYLGTGSGKTFIAVMLIQHLRGELGKLEKGRIQGGKKAIFLVSSVALVEQQAREIRNTTGLQVGTYCGSDGVDDWEEYKWMDEFSKYQVLVFVHEVFRSVLSCKFLQFRDLALLVLDECHHAVKNHPYSVIMNMYNENKSAGNPVPKVLGLTVATLQSIFSSRRNFCFLNCSTLQVSTTTHAVNPNTFGTGFPADLFSLYMFMMTL